MGAKESKQTCISYEDAVKRVSESELRRLKEAFKKSAGVGRFYLSRNAFQQDVLFEGVPANVTDLLYTACGGTNKGISFKDLLCGLVLITKGTEDEKIRFLWNLYCNDSGTYILKSDFTKALNLLPYENASLFAQTDRINFEQFQAWLLKNRTSTVLSKWLLSDNCISLTSELETPTFYQSLAGVTHLEEKDIVDLEKEFWRLKNSSPNGQLDRLFLAPLLSPPIPKHALQGLFNAFDENRDGHIDFKELCCGVSAACRGPGVERTRFCFKIFDVDSDGVLSHSETLQMINVLLYVAKENRNVDMYKDITKQEALRDIVNFTNQKGGGTAGVNDNKMMLADMTITLTAEDFMMWNVESSLKLLQPFLDLIFEVCHIVFGLWPQCRHMEHDIVRGWLDREEKRKYTVGQFWYLISRDWWIQWLHYVNNTTVSCEYCKNTTNGTYQRTSFSGIDEAVVCDETFNTNSLDSVAVCGDLGGAVSADNCSLGSSSSGISSCRQMGARPGPIDNTNLVTPNPYKNVRTLTGEGGHLKRDTPLVQNHNFELVPKSLWKALNRWYGDNLPLPRQVIQPPNTNQVELELYPLNLRILLHQIVPQQQQQQMANNWGAMTSSYGVIASGGGFAAISSPNVLQQPKRYLAYTAAFSRLATVQKVAAFLCEQLRLRSDDIRLWHIPSGNVDNSAILLEEDSMTLKELMIKDNDQILLEIRNKDQTWPEELGSLCQTQSGGSSINDRRLTRTSIMSLQSPGATGLHNLGNTCFMNASLQVLFNTQPLAQYFRQNMHLFELNTTNKLGTRGNLATRYGELLKEVWSATARSVAPLKLRFVVTKYAPRFAGGGQHDSQELLEWLLDALHEDLNRVMEKPYSELKDSNGRPDKIVAAEAWSQHHARNQSIIIDLFYGQLKSKVSCMCCGRESVRFDPFSLLSLPLPVENYIYFEVLVILLDGSVPVKYGLRLNSECKYFDLKRKLACVSYLNPNFMLICEIWNSQIRHIFPDEEKIKPTAAKELYCYQLPEECQDRSRSSSTMGVNIEKGLKDIQRSSAAMLTAYDSFSSLNAINNSTGNGATTTATNTISNNSNLNGGDRILYAETSFEEMVAPPQLPTSPPPAPTAQPQPSQSAAINVKPTSKSSALQQRYQNNSFDNVPMTVIGGGSCGHDDGDETEDDDIHVSTKVRRCFGNNMCMPQTLLCFKHTSNVSRSPENTFVNGGSLQKNISTSKLLHGTTTEPNTCSSSSIATATHSGENSMESSTCDPAVINNSNNSETPSSAAPVMCEGGLRRLSECPCRLNNTADEANAQRLMESEINRQNFLKQELNDSFGGGMPLNGMDGGLFSRMPSQHYKVGKYLMALHRKITRQDSYFLSHHKTRPSIFGVPLLIPNLEGGTNKDLYCAVWLQVSRLLTPLPASTDQANHAADCDDSLGYDFPFSLRAVKSDGLTCALCPWSNFCRGCEIPCNNEYVFQSSLFNNSFDTSNTSTPKMMPKSANNSMVGTLDNRKPLNSTSSDRDSLQSQQSMILSRNYDNKYIIAIDWDPTALHLRYQCTLERLWVDHESVEICRKEQIEPVDLNHCLRAFTSEEKLEEWYHCSHCKGKKPATKKLQIWKLPPILIIHLKRFNCVNNKWVKSQKVVHFPLDDFDPTPYLAAVPQETILRHKELLEMNEISKTLNGINENNEAITTSDITKLQQQQQQKEVNEEKDENNLSKAKSQNETTNKITPTANIAALNNGNNAPAAAADTNNKPLNGLTREAQLALNEKVNNILNLQQQQPAAVAATTNKEQILDACCNIIDSKCCQVNGVAGATNATTTLADDYDEEEEESSDKMLDNAAILRKAGDDRTMTRRKRLISTSLTKTPIVDGAFEDFHQHKLKKGDDPFDPKYKLYAVVSHSGMLNGGHYVSYAANPNGSWYCYNDSSCREISNPPNIDPSSAYLLFYERKGLDYEPYLPNIEGKTLPSGVLGNEDNDETENDLKKMCTIS
ncbi:ubiquitin carboxyl-terminal hydrolase 32 isoform X3 [Musca domestica]|uniref:ubiquitinyl hydrolase 1 n=1 Tax=Musca domestica TaxID=7370 RepID=A0ABM3UPA8_MUSDO|nr:ubiquitin carboxyl-terminal hydrolase 32 isoform X3 [Musca domestica]